MTHINFIIIALSLFCGSILQAQSPITATYQYDNLSRLTHTTYSNGLSIVYSYDILGNRTSRIVTGNGCAAPVAGFTAVPNTLSVAFTSTSSNSPTSYVWDFGNGQSAAQANPSITYTQAGTYNVCLTVTNACGSNQFCQQVTVSSCSMPLAGYSNNVNGLSVSFTDLSSNSPASYAWNFGDGQVSTQSSPTVVYTMPGTYNVCLTVLNACGSNQFCQQVTVSCTAPLPVVSFVNTVNSLTVSFNNTSQNGTSYLWDFGNGQTSTLANPVFTYPVAGTYNVCLTVNNTCNAVQACQQVTAQSCSGTISEHIIYTGLNSNPQIAKQGYLYHNGIHYLVWSNGSTNGNTTYNNYDAKVKLSTSSDGISWSTQDILTTTMGSQNHVLCIDNTGKLHLAYNEGSVSGYYGLQATNLVYANNVSGSWVKYNTNLGTGNGYSYNHTVPYQLYWGSDNKLRLYYANTGWWAFGAPLLMRVYDNGAWSNAITISNTNDGGADSQNNIWTSTKEVNGQISVYVSNGWSCSGNGCSPGFYNTIKEFSEGPNYAYNQINTINNTRWYYENSMGSNLSVPSNGQDINVNGALATTLTGNEIVYNGLWINDQSSRLICNTSTHSRVYSATGQPLLSGTGKFTIPGHGFDIVVDWSVNPRRVYAVHYGTNSAPVANFSSNISGLNVNFSNTTQGANSYTWDFGNGQTSSNINPSVTYAAPGTYTVCLLAGTICNSSQICQQITVSCPLPNPSISPANASICTGQTVTLTATGGNSYLWNNGATTNAITVSSGGLYSVTAQNACGTSVAYQTVVPQSTPSAMFNYAITGNTITFFNTSVNGTSYAWDFDDGQTSTFMHPVVSFANSDEYVVCLVAYNDCGLNQYCEAIELDLNSGTVSNSNGQTFKIYPNPNTGTFTLVVEGNVLHQASISLFDALGQNLNTWYLDNQNQMDFDISEYPAGAYFLKLSSPNGDYSKIIIKQ